MTVKQQVTRMMRSSGGSGGATVTTLTLNGYCKRDVYESLDAAVSTGQAQRAVSLAAELACTRNEGGALISHLLATYATWYASGCGHITRMMAGYFRALGGTPAAMGQLPNKSDRRAALCSVVLSLCMLPRRPAPYQLQPAAAPRTGGASTTVSSGSTDAVDDAGSSSLATLNTMLASRTLSSSSRVDDACMLAEAVLCARSSSGSSDNSAAAARNGGSAAGDPAWRLWGVLEAQAAAAAPAVQAYLRDSLDMYSTGLQAYRYRAARVGLLLSTVRVCARGALSAPLLDAQALARLAQLDEQGRHAIDDVFLDVTCSSDDSRKDGAQPSTAVAPSDGTTHTAHVDVDAVTLDPHSSTSMRVASTPTTTAQRPYQDAPPTAVADWDDYEAAFYHDAASARASTLSTENTRASAQHSVGGGGSARMPLYLRCFCRYDNALRVQMAEETQRAKQERHHGAAATEHELKCVVFRVVQPPRR